MHAHGADSHGAASRLMLVLGATAVYLIAEVVGGLLTGSLALLADSAHLLTDVLGLAMASIGPASIGSGAWKRCQAATRTVVAIPSSTRLLTSAARISAR